MSIEKRTDGGVRISNGKVNHGASIETELVGSDREVRITIAKEDKSGNFMPMRLDAPELDALIESLTQLRIKIN
jgi:hypothetical protein